MRKLALALILALLVAAVPTVSFTEDTAAVRLARTLYALAGDGSYETKLALGSVVMNRVEHDLYPDTLSQVLSQAQQFPCGSRYDEDSLAAAHAVIAGKRTLPENAVVFRSRDAASLPDDSLLCGESGNYLFYSADLHRPLDY